MITDMLVHHPTYHALSPRIAAALRFVEHSRGSALSLGRHDIDSDRVFALVQEYVSRPDAECVWESHRRYIDVQFIESGTESIEVAPTEQLRPRGPYDSSRDVTLYDGSGQVLRMEAGRFAIFYPHDGHRPCIAVTAPAPVRKVVVKVAVD